MNKVSVKAIVKMREKFPCYTLQRIGDEFGVTRERIRQILSSEGRETKSLQRLTPRRCQRCGAKISTNRLHCKKCQYELHHVQLECGYCGKLFWRRVSEVLHYSFIDGLEIKNARQHYFCNRSCFGKWVTSSHGFRYHPSTGKRLTILKNLFEENYQLINVTRITSWKTLLSSLSSREILCLDLGRDANQIRSTLHCSSARYNCPIESSVIEGKLYVRKKEN